MRVILFGSSGILGSGYRAVLSQLGADVVRLRPDWRSAADASARLRVALDAEPTTLIWAAGVGHVGADERTMRAETEMVASICDTVVAASADVAILYASSAGALFAGIGPAQINEDENPRPTTHYGYAKLRQEELLRRVASERALRVVICRYTNLYGLADGRLTTRGVVPTAIRATRLRQPMVVYVSPDTRRDLVYSVDAAAESLALLREAAYGVTTEVVSEGETRTVSEVLALVGRVAGRRVPAVYAERPETRVQPRVLRFGRIRPHRVRHTPMETALHLMLQASMS